MPMILVKYARTFNDVFIFVSVFMRVSKNHRSCSGMRELARVYYRAHQVY